MYLHVGMEAPRWIRGSSRGGEVCMLSELLDLIVIRCGLKGRRTGGDTYVRWFGGTDRSSC